jgi:hypothetical protein
MSLHPENATPGERIFYSPFSMQVSPMQRLALINIQNDPDEIYEGFEPQVFDDAEHGRGLLVIGYRRDGTVDVYHQPGLRLDPATYAVVLKGLNQMVEHPLGEACFEASERGIEIDFELDDLLGRQIHVEIREDMQRPRRAFPLLAPLGSATENPPALPLFWLFDFGFVRQKGTRYRVNVDGRQHKLDGMPVPVAGERVFFTRYTTDPVILSLNPNFEGSLAAVQVPRAGLKRVEQAGTFYELTEGLGLERMWVEYANSAERPHPIETVFSPPFPDLTTLEDGQQAQGSFVVQSREPGDASGTVSGTWSALREGQKVQLRLHPGGGWKPQERRLSVRIIFTVAKVFRTWPTTYEWTAEIDLAELTQKSGWKRTG